MRISDWSSDVCSSDLGEQAGFARIVTDATRFVWLSDVYILPVHRGRGLVKWLIETVISDPALAKVRRMLLSTNDAHALYKEHGFDTIEGNEASNMMMLLRSHS